MDVIASLNSKTVNSTGYSVEHKIEKDLLLHDDDKLDERHCINETDDEKTSPYNLPSDETFFLALTDQKYYPREYQQHYNSNDEGQAIDNYSDDDDDHKEEDELMMRNRKSLSNIDMHTLLNDSIWQPLVSLQLFLFWLLLIIEPRNDMH